MTDGIDPRFLALLVHRGLLPPDVARAAMAAADPERYLLDHGHVTSAALAEWQRTDAGTRPQLSRYELGELLGEGGTARVFEAKDRTVGDIAALKILNPELCKDPTAVQDFVRESKWLIELESDHIVSGHRVAREGDTVYCEMELLEGRCLQDGLSPDNPLPELQALDIVVQVAEALAYLHGKGLVHRDIKPGNIVLTDTGRAVLIDLGFATDRSANPDGGQRDSTLGTVHYISPEQARGSADLDVRADIYSLGCTLYHLVTGALPFEGATSEEVMARQVLDDLSSEKIRALGLSQQTHYFIQKMMAKEKEIRFQDPHELIAAIKAYLDSVAWEEHQRVAAAGRGKRVRTTMRTRGASPRRRGRGRRRGR